MNKKMYSPCKECGFNCGNEDFQCVEVRCKFKEIVMEASKGLVYKLPFKPGTLIYEVSNKGAIGESIVSEFKINSDGELLMNFGERWVGASLLGNKYFLDRKEAVKKLDLLKLSEVLLKKTGVGDIVLIHDSVGWQIGCTMIDNEDLFLQSLDSDMLSKKVEKYEYVEVDWTTRKVMEVYLAE